MKFIYEIRNSSKETTESIQKEGIKPRERFGHRYVCLFPLLEKDGELIDLWKHKYQEWAKPPVKDSIVAELPDDALVEFFIEDFAFGNADVVYRVKDIELILKEIYAYGKENYKTPYKSQTVKYDEEGDAIEKDGSVELFDYCLEGSDSFIARLDMLEFVCRYDDTLKISKTEPKPTEEKSGNELKKIEQAYSTCFSKAAKSLGLEPVKQGIWYEKEFTDIPFGIEKKISLSTKGVKTNLRAELSNKYNRLTFTGSKLLPGKQTMPEIILSAWSLASQNICISVDYSYYKKIEKLKSKLLNELWPGIKIPEHLPEWMAAEEKMFKHSGLLLKSALERKTEDEEFIDACREITEILKS